MLATLLHVLQLIMRLLALQVLHGHNLDHQTRPAGKMLRALPRARLRIVLLPRVARLLPAVVHGVDQVLAQANVQVARLLAVRAALRGKVLCRSVSNFM